MPKLTVLVGSSVTFHAWGGGVVRFPENELTPKDQLKVISNILRSGEDEVVQTISEVVVLSAILAHVERRASVKLHVALPPQYPDYLGVPVQISLDADGRPSTPILEQFFAPVGEVRRALIEARRRVDVTISGG